MSHAFSLNASYKVNGSPESFSTTSFKPTIEAAIKDCISRIKKENKGATDIVVSEEPKNGGKPYMLDKLIECIQSVRPDLTLDHLNRYGWMILMTDRNDYREGGFWMNLPEAKRFMDADGDYDDYVYLRRFGIVLFNVGRHTSHEIFTSHWNWIETVLFNDTTTNMDDMPSFDYGDESEMFLHNKCGFFMSRAFNMRSVLKSADMRLTASEKIAFGHIKFRDIER